MRLIRLIVPFIAAAVLIPLGTTSADAAPSIRFLNAQYDSPGNDLPRTNTKLNAEWVRVKNFSSVTRSLSGWRIDDPQGHRYTFPTGSKLGPGQSVAIHTGTGSNTTAHKYWRASNYVWNNTGDTARFRTPAGTLIDSCKWGDGSGKITC
jgi:hypothetical protein